MDSRLYPYPPSILDALQSTTSRALPMVQELLKMKLIKEQEARQEAREADMLKIQKSEEERRAKTYERQTRESELSEPYNTLVIEARKKALEKFLVGGELTGADKYLLDIREEKLNTITPAKQREINLKNEKFFVDTWTKVSKMSERGEIEPENAYTSLSQSLRIANEQGVINKKEYDEYRKILENFRTSKFSLLLDSVIGIFRRKRLPNVRLTPTVGTAPEEPFNVEDLYK